MHGNFDLFISCSRCAQFSYFTPARLTTTLIGRPPVDLLGDTWRIIHAMLTVPLSLVFEIAIQLKL